MHHRTAASNEAQGAPRRRLQRPRDGRLATGLLLASVAVLALPATAPATVMCSYSSPRATADGTVSIATAGVEHVTMRVMAGGAIEVASATGPIGCGGGSPMPTERPAST